MPLRSPNHSLWRRLNAHFETRGGWQIPLEFAGTSPEYNAARQSAVLIDESHRGKLMLTGRDTMDLLQRILSQDVVRLKTGDTSHAALLNAQGKILMDMQIAVLPEGVLLITECGLEETLGSLLDRYIIADDVSVKNVTKDYAWMLLYGPAVDRIKTKVLSKPELINSLLSFNAPEIPAGFFFLIKTAESANATESLLKLSAGDLPPAGSAVSEILRIEDGRLRYGIDMTADTILSETGKDEVWASETKGCYPGQEVVARIKTYSGLQRRLCGFTFSKNSLPAHGGKVYSGEKEIGWITSACVSPELDKGIALGYLAKGYFDQDCRVGIETAAGKVPAEKVKLPFTSLFPTARRGSS